MNILIEGWRNINHSYSLVNQWQIYELIKSSNIFFKDVSFSNENWSPQRNDSGLRDEVKNIINKIPLPSDDIDYDITYRISGPFNFDKKFNSKIVFVFATSEYKNNLTKLYADKIEYDLIERKSKISMFNKNKKIKVTHINNNGIN